MNFELAQLTDGDLAAALAEQAGQHLLNLRTERFAQNPNPDSVVLKALGDEADRTANDLIVGSLKSLRPNDAILSEESTDDLARLDADRVWIVDPLDGTREYKIAGNSEWAVHIALWEREHNVNPNPNGTTSATPATSATSAISQDGPVGYLKVGVVGLPTFGMVLRSDQPGDPFSAPSAPSGRLRIVRSASREQPVADGVAQRLNGELISMGSAGAKAMAVVRGEAEVYIHTGGQWEWDSAAPIVVAQGHGLFVARIDGSTIRYNQRDPYLPDLVVCRADLSDQVMAAVHAVTASLP